MKWFLSGLVAGVMVTLLAQTLDLGARLTAGLSRSGFDLSVPSSGVDLDNASDRTERREKVRPSFEFYTMLPEMEVAIPEEVLDAEQGGPTSNPTLVTEPNGVAQRYLLQVASFQKPEDADRLRGELTLLGLSASIQTVTIDGTGTWHRVRVGPLRGLGALNAARGRLRDHDLESLVLRLK